MTHVCTLYQIVYALTSFREWLVPDSRSHTPYKAGVCCQYREMTIAHRHRPQNERYSFSISTKMINIDNYFLIRYVNLTFNNEKFALNPVICEVRLISSNQK